MSRTTRTTRTARRTAATSDAVTVTVSRASRRGKYAFAFTGTPAAVAAAMGDVPAVAPVRTRDADDGTRTVTVRVGANPASRIIGTACPHADADDVAAVAAGADTGGRPLTVHADDVARVAEWVGTAARVWADRRAAGQRGVAGDDAVDSVAVGIAAGGTVESAMADRAAIARRPTTHRALIVRAMRAAADADA